MNNAERFKQTFGIYAEEFWSFDEKQMLDWLNEDVPDTNVGDTISRQAAVDNLISFLQLDGEYAWGIRECLNGLPSAQPEQDGEVAFWKERAREYENIILSLVAEQAKGVKFDSIEVTEEGIRFKKSQPETR